MESYMHSQFHHRFSASIPNISLSSSTYNSPKHLTCFWKPGGKDKRLNLSVHPICYAISKTRTDDQEYYKEVLQNDLPVIKWHEIVDDGTEDTEANKVILLDEIKERVDLIRSMLDSMEDGDISISAYDTAWLALVKNVNGSGAPQFPTSLQWIATHQLPDGSWGDSSIFSAHDRIINTLACVIALKSWDIHPEKRERGMLFLRENICKLEDENVEHMPIGFEVAFPSLIAMAQKLDIEVSDDSPFLQEIYAKRNLKLKMIPKDTMHTVPTTLLYSMEGMSGLDWEKLIKLQCQDGSFLFSPSSTAFAFMQTEDANCLGYLKQVVRRFDGGVPCVYPVDLFERIWAVDRLQRLGISRYFQDVIKECLDYVYRYWTEKGICWTRNSPLSDMDDTAMGFRILRLHGYEVSANVFRQFAKDDGGFVSIQGQSIESVTGMSNLYRASHVMFPGETVLVEANNFSFKFLKEKQASNELLDKWIITKDLPGEVGYVLNVPWYASLPRVETRFYIDQYGGEDDVWIGKTLYRMHCVNNNSYLELAKIDFNHCQAQHQLEWNSIQKWYTDSSFGDFGISRRSLLLAYFLPAASIFELERSNERLAWAKTAVLIEIIASYFTNEGTSSEHRMAFINELKSNSGTTQNYVIGKKLSDQNKTSEGLVGTLLGIINQHSLVALVAHGRDIRHHLCCAWAKWLQTLHKEGDRYQGEAELLVQTINHCSGSRLDPDEALSSHHLRLSELTSRVCHQLRDVQKHKVHDNGSYDTINDSMTPQIEIGMQELAQLVLQNSPDKINADIKQTFLNITKCFYYTAHCNHEAIDSHIAKVLFERVN